MDEDDDARFGRHEFVQYLRQLAVDLRFLERSGYGGRGCGDFDEYQQGARARYDLLDLPKASRRGAVAQIPPAVSVAVGQEDAVDRPANGRRGAFLPAFADHDHEDGQHLRPNRYQHEGLCIHRGNVRVCLCHGDFGGDADRRRLPGRRRALRRRRREGLVHDAGRACRGHGDDDVVLPVQRRGARRFHQRSGGAGAGQDDLVH